MKYANLDIYLLVNKTENKKLFDLVYDIRKFWYDDLSDKLWDIGRKKDLREYCGSIIHNTNRDLGTIHDYIIKNELTEDQYKSLRIVLKKTLEKIRQAEVLFAYLQIVSKENKYGNA